DKIAPTLTTERMISDLEEMAAWARREFAKDKIFLFGHSYGSFLGLQFAQRHPEWLYAHIGVGQSIDGPENERRAGVSQWPPQTAQATWRRYTNWKESPRMPHPGGPCLLRIFACNANGSVITAA